MYKVFHYYVLDEISETVISHFYANNDRMAKKIMDGFDYKKAHLDPSDISVICDMNPCDVYETYSEVCVAENRRLCDFFTQTLEELNEAGK